MAVKPPFRTVQPTLIPNPEAPLLGPVTASTTRSGGGVSVICAAFEAPTFRSDTYSNTFPASDTSWPAKNSLKLR